MAHQRRYLIGDTTTWLTRSQARYALTVAGAAAVDNRLSMADIMGVLRLPVTDGTVTMRSAWSDEIA